MMSPIVTTETEHVVLPDQTVRTIIETRILEDPELLKRIALLEESLTSLKSKFGDVGVKLSKLDSIEPEIEQYAVKHLQQNFVQIFNANAKDGSLYGEDFKVWFQSNYASKDDIEILTKNLRDKLAEERIDDVKETVPDERIVEDIVEKYLAVHEMKQLEMLTIKFKEYVKERTVTEVVQGEFDPSIVKKIVTEMLAVYDADKTGLVDYAMESAGGEVVSTKCTETYDLKTKQYVLFGLPVWWPATSPRHALTPGAQPGDCWAFQGFPGYLVIRTFAIINVTQFSLEHTPRSLTADGKIESAPKNFSVWGLHDELDQKPHLFGRYTYEDNGTPIQYFPVQYASQLDIEGRQYPVGYDLIELQIDNNHGNPTFTCLYRFRVHGTPVTDIRAAAEYFMGNSVETT